MAPWTSVSKQHSRVNRNIEQRLSSNNQKDKRIMEDEMSKVHTSKLPSY